MSRDLDPIPGQWYEDLDRGETFLVVAVDPDEDLVRIQWLDAETQDLDLDTWGELDLEASSEPEGWAGASAAEDDEDWDDEEADWDEDEDEEDDWDEDEDYGDEDDEYRDRE